MGGDHEVRLPKLTRKQKVAVYLSVIVLCLGVMAWMLEFPAWSAERMLDRVEREYFLEDSELLFTGSKDGSNTAYARNGDLLLTIMYTKTPLGLTENWSNIYEEPDGIYCTSRNFEATEVLAFGDMRGAVRAELEVTLDVTLKYQPTWMHETYIAEGVQVNPDCFYFALTPHYTEADDSREAETEREVFAGERVADQSDVQLRLYDESGNLIHTKHLDYVETDSLLKWPEIPTQ